MKLFDGLDIYLTEPARELKTALVEQGLDADLAHLIIEENFPEPVIYQIEEITVQYEVKRIPETDKCPHGRNARLNK